MKMIKQKLLCYNHLQANYGKKRKEKLKGNLKLKCYQT